MRFLLRVRILFFFLVRLDLTAAPPFNGSFPTRMPNLWNYSSALNITAPTCDNFPVNLNQSYGTSLQYVVDRDLAFNFPVVDILTFFPLANKSESQGAQSDLATQAKLMCLRPEGVAEGSTQARSAREVLDGMDGSETEGSGAERLGGKSLTGMVVAMAVMFALNM
jgi:hypothetical protein